MREYARRGHRVLFVEAWLTWIKLFRSLRNWRAFFDLFRGPRLTREGVFAVTVPPHFPGGEWLQWISIVNWKMTEWWLKRMTFRRLRLARPRLFLFAPLASSLVGRFHESCSIYFCNDPFKQIFSHPSAHASIERIENELTRNVDIVFAVSEQLVEERKRHNSKTFLIPLAADVELFARAMDDSTEVPAELTRFPKPLFGHVGVLNTRLDVNLVRTAAKELPRASFVFIGPVTEVSGELRREIESLRALPNVFFLGNKEEHELPSYLKGIDVCIIPYLRDEVTKYIKANAKFYQYVASGKPIVSTIGPYDFEDEIIINCTTAEDFVAGLQRALSLTTDDHRRKRQALSSVNSWSSRVDEIEQILSTHLPMEAA